MATPGRLSLWNRIFLGLIVPIIVAFAVIFYAFHHLRTIHLKVELVETADDIHLTLLEIRSYEKNLLVYDRSRDQLYTFMTHLDRLSREVNLLRTEIVAEINRENHKALLETIEKYKAAASEVIARIDERQRLVTEIRTPGREIEQLARDKAAAFEVRRHEKNYLIYEEDASALNLRAAARQLAVREPTLAPAVERYIKVFLAIIDASTRKEEAARAMGRHGLEIERHLAEFAKRERQEIGGIISFAEGLFVWTFVFLFGTAVSSGFLTTMNIVMPLKLLVRSFERLSAGDYSKVTFIGNFTTPTEVSALFSAYNTTVQAVSESKSRLDEALARLNQANRDLLAHQDELAEAKKATAMRLLASEIAHELNNPLSSLTMLLHLFDEEFPDGHPKKAQFQLMLNELHRGRLILSELADFARKEPLRLQEVNLRQLVEETAAIVRRQNEERSVELSLHLEAVPERVPLDAVLVQQALLNVLSNAFDYTPHGGRIEIRASAQAGCVSLEVADSGAGIRPEALPYIFEPFFTTRKEFGGSGLGLSLARKIIERHRGSLHAENRPGGGALFRITLPVRGDGA